MYVSVSDGLESQCVCVTGNQADRPGHTRAQQMEGQRGVVVSLPAPVSTTDNRLSSGPSLHQPPATAFVASGMVNTIQLLTREQKTSRERKWQSTHSAWPDVRPVPEHSGINKPVCET